MSSSRRRPVPQQSSLPPEVRNRLESVVENVRLVHKQIHDDRSVPVHRTLLPSEFPSRLAQCAQGVSDGCTKLAVLFSRPPVPSVEDCGAVCVRIEQATLQLASVYFQLSPNQGRTLQKEIRSAVLRILDGIEKLALVVIENGCSGDRARLQGTGSVWESCDAIAKLSKDNHSATLRVFISQLHLLQDACSEMEELKANNGLSDEMEVDDFFTMDHEVESLASTMASAGVSERTASSSVNSGVETGGTGVEGRAAAVVDDGRPREWTEEEAKVAGPCLTLIQLSTDIAGTVSRLIISGGSVREEQVVHELDAAAEGVQQFSPLIDDLAGELPAPVSQEKCARLGKQLGTALMDFINTLSGCHFCAEGWDCDKHRAAVGDAMQLIPT